MTDTTHPEWLAVGAEVEVIRSHGRSVAFRRAATVVRHTKTTVVLDTGERYRRAARRIPETYELTPPYIDYRTRLAPKAGAEVTSRKGADEHS